MVKSRTDFSHRYRKRSLDGKSIFLLIIRIKNSSIWKGQGVRNPYFMASNWHITLPHFNIFISNSISKSFVILNIKKKNN